MSLLIELIKTIAEAVEESRSQGRPKPVAGGAPLPMPDQGARGEERRHVLSDGDAPELHEVDDTARTQQRLQAKHGEALRQRAKVDRAAAAAQAQAAAAARSLAAARPARPQLGPARIARLLQQPDTVRDLLVLKEVLDRPLALRRRR
jgi:hypothetical protein